MNSGVYIIENEVTGGAYIGSSVNLYNRMSQHIATLSNNKHYNRYLQKIYNKYGKNILSFRILIYCDPENCILYEQRFIDFYKPRYNINPRAESCAGRKLTEEHKRKISKAHIGKKASDETKKKLSVSHVGKIPWNKGKKMSIESKEKMRIHAIKDGRIPPSRKGIELTEEHKRNISLGLKKFGERSS